MQTERRMPTAFHPLTRGTAIRPTALVAGRMATFAAHRAVGRAPRCQLSAPALR